MFLDILFRMYQRRSFHRRWFCIDKPARIKGGAGLDGLFEKERSEGDKERLGQAPQKLNTCAQELRRRWG